MRLHDVLEHAPVEVFDFIMEAEGAGYIPSEADFIEVFGETEWIDILELPMDRVRLDEEVTEEYFSPQIHGEMKDCGHQLSDFE